MNEFSDDFTTEMKKEENRPFLLIEIYFGNERGTWRLTTWDEEVEISYDDPEYLLEP
jgi:hypothetical protein